MCRTFRIFRTKWQFFWPGKWRNIYRIVTGIVAVRTFVWLFARVNSSMATIMARDFRWKITIRTLQNRQAIWLMLSFYMPASIIKTPKKTCKHQLIQPKHALNGRKQPVRVLTDWAMLAFWFCIDTIRMCSRNFCRRNGWFDAFVARTPFVRWIDNLFPCIWRLSPLPLHGDSTCADQVFVCKQMIENKRNLRHKNGS